MPLSGVHAAAITPRNAEGGIDFGASFELLDHSGRAGLDGILLFGDAAEALAFAREERSRLAYLAAKRSRVPVLVGIGGPTLELAVGLGREASRAGVAGLLLPPPPGRYDAEDVAEFWEAVARSLDGHTPLYLHNTALGSPTIPVEETLSLLGTGLFAGIVEESADDATLDRLGEAARSGGFDCVSGADCYLAEARLRGLAAISAAACAVPELAVALDRSLKAGDRDAAGRLRAAFDEFLGWVRCFPPGVAIKAAMGLRGIAPGPLPLPLSGRRERELEQFREWFRARLPEWRKPGAHA